MTWFCHGLALVFEVAPRVRSLAMAAWPMIDPIFPDPAEIPWDVERYRVGKHSPGTIKVVVLGPRCVSAN
jgi:hypothetical protein